MLIKRENAFSSSSHSIHHIDRRDRAGVNRKIRPDIGSYDWALTTGH